MAIYNHSPVWMQNFACNIEGYRIFQRRFGRYFWKTFERYKERCGWPYEALCEFRDKRLRKMIMHCYNTVPYYTACFKDGGVNPQNIKRLDDLVVLPVISKDIIKENYSQFLSSAYPRGKMVSQHTSGTTGGGFVFQSTQEALCQQWAVWWRYRENLGIYFNTWCAVFGGRGVVPLKQTNPPYYRVNGIGRQIYFSGYHMAPDTMKEYIRTLEKYRPSWIHGYPSLISLLANYMNENAISLSYQVKWITTGAENLLDQQKKAIIKAFGIEPYQHYGMAEGVANISENMEHQYAIDEDYAALELLYDETVGGCRVIGTSLTNYAMPLLRYEVGDIAQIDNRSHRRVLSVDGRKEDYLTLSNGVKIGRLDHIFKDMANVKEAQIRQDKYGRITFLIVKNCRYKAADEDKLKLEIMRRLGKEPFTISYREKIERTQSGKIRFVISEKKADRV